MVGSDVLERAWEMLNDTGTPKRNGLPLMTNMLNDGVRDALSRRPYLNILADGTLAAAFEDLTFGAVEDAELPLEDTMREALAHYIASRIYEMDASDEYNANQAQYHRVMYQRLT